MVRASGPGGLPWAGPGPLRGGRLGQGFWSAEQSGDSARAAAAFAFFGGTPRLLQRTSIRPAFHAPAGHLPWKCVVPPVAAPALQAPQGRFSSRPLQRTSARPAFHAPAGHLPWKCVGPPVTAPALQASAGHFSSRPLQRTSTRPAFHAPAGHLPWKCVAPPVAALGNRRFFRAAFIELGKNRPVAAGGALFRRRCQPYALSAPFPLPLFLCHTPSGNVTAPPGSSLWLSLEPASGPVSRRTSLLSGGVAIPSLVSPTLPCTWQSACAGGGSGSTGCWLCRYGQCGGVRKWRMP